MPSTDENMQKRGMLGSSVPGSAHSNQLIELKEVLETFVDKELPPEYRKKFHQLIMSKGREGYAVLQEWEPVFDHLIEIENTEAESIDAPTDFTRETIGRRRRAGYRDAKTQLREFL
jgi:hypothetical protein